MRMSNYLKTRGISQGNFSVQSLGISKELQETGSELVDRTHRAESLRVIAVSDFGSPNAWCSYFAICINKSTKNNIFSGINDLRGTFTFPREDKRLKNRLKKENLPREEEILNLDIKATVEEALENVIEDMKHFRIKAKENDWKYMQVPLIRRKQNIEVTQENEDIDEDDAEARAEVDQNPEENEIDQDVAKTNNISNEDDIVMDLISSKISNENSESLGECDFLETNCITLKDLMPTANI